MWVLKRTREEAENSKNRLKELTPRLERGWSLSPGILPRASHFCDNTWSSPSCRCALRFTTSKEMLPSSTTTTTKSPNLGLERKIFLNPEVKRKHTYKEQRSKIIRLIKYLKENRPYQSCTNLTVTRLFKKCLINYFIFREREKGDGERENTDLLFRLLMHSLVDSCLCPHQELNPQPWRSRDNALINWATGPGRQTVTHLQ